MGHKVDFDKYQVVVLVNNKEIIVKNFSFVVDMESNIPFMICTGILNNSWTDLAINNANIIYVRDLFESEKRIVGQIEDSSK